MVLAKYMSNKEQLKMNFVNIKYKSRETVLLINKGDCRLIVVRQVLGSQADRAASVRILDRRLIVRQVLGS